MNTPILLRPFNTIYLMVVSFFPCCKQEGEFNHVIKRLYNYYVFRCTKCF